MRTLVSLDTETGIIRRYSESAQATHAAGLTSDPEDGDRTRGIIEGFRVHPSGDHAIKTPRLRTWDDALREQRPARYDAEQRGRQSLLLEHTHRDEA
jgi:hypothetical protein